MLTALSSHSEAEKSRQWHKNQAHTSKNKQDAFNHARRLNRKKPSLHNQVRYQSTNIKRQQETSCLPVMGTQHIHDVKSSFDLSRAVGMHMGSGS